MDGEAWAECDRLPSWRAAIGFAALCRMAGVTIAGDDRDEVVINERLAATIDKEMTRITDADWLAEVGCGLMDGLTHEQARRRAWGQVWIDSEMDVIQPDEGKEAA